MQNRLNTNGSQSDFVHPKYPTLFGDVTAYQNSSGLISYETNLGRDLFHCVQNPDPDISQHLLDVNGNLTLKEMDKFDIVMQKVKGSSSSYSVYKDEIKD